MEGGHPPPPCLPPSPQDCHPGVSWECVLAAARSSKQKQRELREEQGGELPFLLRTMTAERLIQICNTINPLTSMLLGCIN